MATATTTFYRVMVYVGPGHVAHYANQAREAGLTEVVAGTEHVYGVVEAAQANTETDRLLLRQRTAALVYGTPVAAGWRDVRVLGAK
jgi:hypothetical protein